MTIPPGISGVMPFFQKVKEIRIKHSRGLYRRNFLFNGAILSFFQKLSQKLLMTEFQKSFNH